MQSCENRIDVGASIDPVGDLLNAPKVNLEKEIQSNILRSPISSTNKTLIASDSSLTASSTKTSRAVSSSCDSCQFNIRSQSGSINEKQGNYSNNVNIDRVETNTTINEELLAETNEEIEDSESNITIKTEIDIFENNKKKYSLSEPISSHEADINQYETMKYDLLAELINKVFAFNSNDGNFTEFAKLAKTRSKSSLRKVPSTEINDNIISKKYNTFNNIVEIPKYKPRILTPNNENLSPKKRTASKTSWTEESSSPIGNKTKIPELNRVRKQVSNFESEQFRKGSFEKKVTVSTSQSISNPTLQPEVIFYNGSKYSLKDTKPSEKFSVKGMKKYFPQVKSAKNKNVRKFNQNIVKYDKAKKPVKIKEMYKDLFREPVCIHNLFSTSHILKKTLAKENVLVSTSKNEDISRNTQSCSCSINNENFDPISVGYPTNKTQSEQMLPFNNDVINVAIALGYNQHDCFQKYKNISEKDKRVLLPHYSSGIMDILMDIIPSFEMAKQDLLNYQSKRSEATLVIPDGNQCSNVCSAQCSLDKSSQSTLMLSEQKISNCILVNDVNTKTKEKTIFASTSAATTSVDNKQLEISGDSIVRNRTDFPAQNILRKDYSIPNDEDMKKVLEDHDLNKQKQQFLDDFNASSIKGPELWDRLNNILETTVMRLEVSISERIITEIKKLMTDLPRYPKDPIKSPELDVEQLTSIKDTIIEIEPDRFDSSDQKTDDSSKFNITTEHKIDIEDSVITTVTSDDSKKHGNASLQCELVDKKVIDELIFKTHFDEAPDIMPGTSKHYIRELSKPSLLQSCVDRLKPSSATDGYVEVNKDNIEDGLVKVSIESRGATEVRSYQTTDLLAQAAVFVRENIMVLSSIPIFILAMAVLYLFILMTKIP